MFHTVIKHSGYLRTFVTCRKHSPQQPAHFERWGIVKLIPKKDAKLVLIKNWRPLTLLNCDYKIASKAIPSRTKTFLPKLISDDQTGFLKGSCISENIRLLDGVIKYTEEKNIPGLLLFIDFEKAFDTL